MSIRQELEKRYHNLFIDYALDRPLDAKNICSVIRQSLHRFLLGAKKPALYCNGGHTQMLMADFMYELKKVKYIVDNYAPCDEDHGFILIKDEDLEIRGIDAVILSSYKFRNDIKQSMKEKHPDLPVLDIYDEFEQRGIMLQSDYYYSNHPYQHYKRINQLQREIRSHTDIKTLHELYLRLVTKYIHIKDFRTALIKLEEWKKLGGVHQEDTSRIDGLLADVDALYELQKKAAESISENHVLMLCIDGLRYQDLSEEYMPKLSREFEKSAFIFDNAYSFSTSTYESLIPVYSENDDLRTEYYNRNSISEQECRFVQSACKQNRHIYFYTDMDTFVDSPNIKYSATFQTATEKMWSFILDASEDEKGLFYIHILYESHYSFSNPYTENKLISEGTALLFDFLPQKGRRLRTDYEQQHLDSVHYLDDILTPFLHCLKCRMLVYADHGNLILKQPCDIQDISETKLTFSEDWIHIPFLIRSPEIGTGKSKKLMTLMSLNDIIVCLFEQRKYRIPDCAFIKAARSQIYNPDFRYLYKEIGKEKCLLAFELFIFAGGYKVAVYADGTVELWETDDEKICSNNTVVKVFFERIKTYITVCCADKIKIFD
jgi:regulator of replication initiation timing